MDTRKFYRTIVQVEVLSEEPLTDTFDLTALAYDITDGDCVGNIEVVKQEVLDSKATAAALINLGSDPGFFQIGSQEDAR